MPPASKPRTKASANATPEDSPVKSFQLRRRVEAAKEDGDDNPDPVVTFELNGQTFHLHPKRVNGLVVMDAMNMEVSENSEPMWEFFEGILGPDYRRFRKMLRSPTYVIDADELEPLVTWMVEQVGQVPT